MTALRVHPGWFWVKPQPDDPQPAHISKAEWDAAVETWNNGGDGPPPTSEQRQAARNTCLRAGHDWRTLPDGWHLCIRCITYLDPEDQ